MGVDVSSLVWKHSKQGENNLVTLLALADWADEDGLSWYNVEKIAKRVRRSVRQTQRIIKDLEDSGELYRQVGRGRGNPSTYAVLCGFTEAQISSILVRRFEMSPQEATSVASSILQKQNGQPPEKVTPNVTNKKVTHMTPFSKKKGDTPTVEENGKGDIATGARAYDPSLDPSKEEIHPAQSADEKPDDFFVKQNGVAIQADSYADAQRIAEKGGTITQRQALKDELIEKNKQGLLFQAWVEELGKDTLPAAFAYKPYMRFMLQLVKDGYEPPDLTCAASLFKAWLKSHPGRVSVDWAVGAVTTAIRRALDLCKSGICSEDVSAFVTARYAEVDSKGNRFWAGKLVKFDHVAENVANWKAERQPVKSVEMERVTYPDGTYTLRPKS